MTNLLEMVRMGPRALAVWLPHCGCWERYSCMPCLLRQVEAAEAEGKYVILLCAPRGSSKDTVRVLLLSLRASFWPCLHAPSQKAVMQLGAHMKLQLMHCRNPLLKDIPSHSSVMGVRCGVCARALPSPHTGMPRMLSAVCGRRGRKGRMAFAASFQKAYHFRLLFMSSQMSYPIMGALRHSFGEPWEVRSGALFACLPARAQQAQQP